MLPQTILLWLSSALVAAAAKARIVGESRDFRLGSEVENIVLRPSGSALTVVYTYPQIYEVAVRDGAEPRLVHNFTGTHGVSSIAESSTPDVYHVVTGNFSFANFTPTADSYAIHRLSFDRHGAAVVRQLAHLDAMQQPNGMVHVPGTPYVLIADCRAGFVYRFDTEARRLERYFDHPLLKPQPQNGVAFGVNGLKFSRGFLYFSNTNRGFVARIPATGREPCLEGEPAIVATHTAADDFAVNDANGDLWIAANGDEALTFVPGNASANANGTVAQTVLGGGNSTDMLTPTAAIWAKGEEGRTLLVTVSGAIQQFLPPNNYTGGGKVKIVRVD